MRSACFVTLVLAASAAALPRHLSLGDLKEAIDQFGDEMLTHNGLNPASAVADAFGDEEETEGLVDDVPHPVSVHNWGAHLNFGQVSGVSVDPSDNPVFFHRGCHKWDDNTFDRDHILKDKSSAIPNATLVTVDADTGEALSAWGENLFHVPHGVTVDNKGNVYVTDVGLHQVMRFPAGSSKPDLVLGEEFVPGRDGSHFCQPTSVAVAEDSGVFFVGDGYCNSRVLKYDREGKLLKIINGHWKVVHSLALFEDEDVLCLSDREGQKIDCVRAGLRRPKNADADETGEHVISYEGVGRTYAIAAKGTSILSLSGVPSARGITIDTAEQRPRILDQWGQADLVNPHDLAISHFGDSVFVADINTDPAVPNVLKFEVVRTGEFQ